MRLCAPQSSRNRSDTFANADVYVSKCDLVRDLDDSRERAHHGRDQPDFQVRQLVYRLDLFRTYLVLVRPYLVLADFGEGRAFGTHGNEHDRNAEQSGDRLDIALRRGRQVTKPGYSKKYGKSKGPAAPR